MTPQCQEIDRAAINRENARNSTGPRTEAGKEKSSMNALRHGLTAQTVVLPAEDLKKYEALVQSFQDDLKPIGAVEIELVQSLAEDTWRLRRARTAEANLFANSSDDPNMLQALATLSMHQQRINNAFERNLKLLREIQAERRFKEHDDMLKAMRLYNMHRVETSASPDPVPYDPAQDGFVFTLARIQEELHRAQRVGRAYGTEIQPQRAA